MMKIKTIGQVSGSMGRFQIALEKEYIKGLTGIEGFGFLQIVWWADQVEDAHEEDYMVFNKPYKPGPEAVGVFATRSPARPNPICMTVVHVADIDYGKGIVYTEYIDAEPGTPVLDIKPYYPCSDIVANPIMPDWCQDLPNNLEESATYDWSLYFNF